MTDGPLATKKSSRRLRKLPVDCNMPSRIKIARKTRDFGPVSVTEGLFESITEGNKIDAAKSTALVGFKHHSAVGPWTQK
jgi:hypothetical protein